MWSLFNIAAALAAAPIINGEDASTDDYPSSGAMIAEISGYPGPLFMCSSTLIAPDTVLLAAHCVDEESVGGSISGLGWSRSSDLAAWGAGTASGWPDDNVAAVDWVKHEQFSLAALQVGLALNYDIGLMFLEEAVTDVEPAYLPTTEEAAQIVQGAEVVVVGWGYQDASLTGEVGVKQMGVSDISELADYEFHVGAETAAVRKCHGDSGGPSYMELETDSQVKTRVIGVTSHAYDMSDCQETGGVDTRVDYYLAWIDEEMRAACEDGTRVWCDSPGILPPPGPPRTIDDLEGALKLVGCSAAPGAGAWGALAGLLAVVLRRSGRRPRA